jgi:hypothetical protein
MVDAPEWEVPVQRAAWTGEDPGFDVELATRLLSAEMVTRGAAPKVTDDPEQQIIAAEKVGFDHRFMHDESATDRCLVYPCPILGIAWALHHCRMHQRERITRAAQFEFAVAIEESLSDLRRIGAKLGECLGPLVRAMEERHQQEKDAKAQPGGHAHDILCERPRAIVTRFEDNLNELVALALALRKDSSLTEFHRTPQPHPPTLELRNAVWQYLHLDGGLTYPKIAELVPDAKDPSGLRGRIEKAVKGPDMRWGSAGFATRK